MIKIRKQILYLENLDDSADEEEKFLKQSKLKSKRALNQEQKISEHL